MNQTSKNTRRIASAVLIGALSFGGAGMVTATANAAPPTTETQQAPSESQGAGAEKADATKADYMGELPSAMYFQNLDRPVDDEKANTRDDEATATPGEGQEGADSTETQQQAPPEEAGDKDKSGEDTKNEAEDQSADEADPNEVKIARDDDGAGIAKNADAYAEWYKDSVDYTLSTAKALFEANPEKGRAALKSAVASLAPKEEEKPQNEEKKDQGNKDFLDKVKEGVMGKDSLTKTGSKFLDNVKIGSIDTDEATDKAVEAFDKADENGKKAMYAEAVKARAQVGTAVVKVSKEQLGAVKDASKAKTKMDARTLLTGIKTEDIEKLDETAKATEKALAALAAPERTALLPSEAEEDKAAEVKFSDESKNVEKAAVDGVKDTIKALDKVSPKEK